MKQFNWEEFKDKNNKIAVHCKTEEEAKDFCKQMHEHGLKWINGDLYMEKTNYGIYPGISCYNTDGKCSGLDYAEERGYKILEWSDYMKKEFTKADLKDGMVIEYANGKRRLVLNDFIVGKDGYYYLSYYKENLKAKCDPDKDIVRVFKINTATTLDYIFHTKNLELIWEQKETKRMTTEEMRKKLEKLTGEKIEVDPSREEMIGKIKLYCTGRPCKTCILNNKCLETNIYDMTKEQLKRCYKEVMEDGRKESYRSDS